MEDEYRQLIERFYRIHWRLRLRNPTTKAERKVWNELLADLEDLYEREQRSNGNPEDDLLAAQD